MMRKNRKNLLTCDSGAAALEFAIVGPVFIMMLFGIVYLGMLLFSMASMQFAVEEGARCASVKTTVCTDSTATINYTKAAYYGPVSTPSFTYANAACGHSVTSSTNFSLFIGTATITVPLSAAACYP
jgi:Flp pilus assembly protein TadG